MLGDCFLKCVSVDVAKDSSSVWRSVNVKVVGAGAHFSLLLVVCVRHLKQQSESDCWFALISFMALFVFPSFWICSSHHQTLILYLTLCLCYLFYSGVKYSGSNITDSTYIIAKAWMCSEPLSRLGLPTFHRNRRFSDCSQASGTGCLSLTGLEVSTE